MMWSGNAFTFFTLFYFSVNFLDFILFSTYLCTHFSRSSVSGAKCSASSFLSIPANPLASFEQSFDLWILSLIQCALCTGFVLSLGFRPRRKRAKAFTLILSFFVTSKLCYIMAKVLYIDFYTPLWWKLARHTNLITVLWCCASGLLSVFSSNLILNKIPLSPYQPLLLVNNNIEGVKHESKMEHSCSDPDPKSQIPASLAKKSSSIKRLLLMAIVDYWLILLATLFLLIAAISDIFTPFYTGEIIDSIVIEKSRAKFIRSLFTLIVVSVISSFAVGLRGCLFKICISRLNIRIRKSLYRSLLLQDIAFYDVNNSGEITSRLSTDTSTAANSIGLNLNVFTRSFVKLIGIILFMGKLSWQLSIVSFVSLPIIFVISKFYGKFYEKISEKVQTSLANANQIAEECLASIKTVRSFAAENCEFDRYSKSLKSTYALMKREAHLYAGYMWTTNISCIIPLVLTLYYGGELVLHEKLSSGKLVSFIIYQLEMSETFQIMGTVFTGLMEAVGASNKIFSLINAKPHMNIYAGNLCSGIYGNVSFHNVSFAYTSRPKAPVLSNINFEVKAGQVCALVGPSGGGKSTCISLIQNFYEPTSGEVLIDGIKVSSFKHSYLHSKVSIVSQEPTLFARSVKENVLYGMTEEDGISTLSTCNSAPNSSSDNNTKASFNEELLKALKQSHSFDFVFQDLPLTVDTQLGERGSLLSGGQKQRLALARAIVRHPNILILDEATSALDTQTESFVQKAILQNCANKTVIVIAHRLSTIQNADRIIVIDGGQVIQQGSHSELLCQEDGVYANLVKNQLTAEKRS